MPECFGNAERGWENTASVRERETEWKESVQEKQKRVLALSRTTTLSIGSRQSQRSCAAARAVFF